MAIWKDSGLPSSRYGEQSKSKILINPERGPYEVGHSESHELAHFMLMGEGFTSEAPTDKNDHSYGGFMKYVVTKKTLEDDGSVTTTQSKPKNELSRKAAKKIIKAVPRIDDKIQENNN